MNTRWINRGLNVVCVLALLVLNMPAAASIVADASIAPVSASTAPYVAGEVLVRFAPEVGLKLAQRAPDKLATIGVTSLDRLGATHGLRVAAPLSAQAAQEKAQIARAGLPLQADWGDVYKLTFSADADVPKIVAAYAADPAVEWAEPDYTAHATVIPNDPLYAEQWGLFKIAAPDAWDVVTGTQPGVQSIVIAVIDSGIDLTHPDLQANLWVNPGEIPGNGIDDDGNTYVDDVRGWNFVNGTANVYDGNGHGTQVAGVGAAAANNGVGIAGVCWNCKIMPVRVMADSGVSNYSDIALGVRYAAGKGAHVINLSLGGYAYSNALREAIDYAVGKGAVVVGGAGNDNVSTPFYPAAYDDVLAVAGTTAADTKAAFSDYGTWVDVSAPAIEITTTYLGGDWGPANGTSLSSPFVAGVAALIRS